MLFTSGTDVLLIGLLLLETAGVVGIGLSCCCTVTAGGVAILASLSCGDFAVGWGDLSLLDCGDRSCFSGLGFFFSLFLALRRKKFNDE